MYHFCDQHSVTCTYLVCLTSPCMSIFRSVCVILIQRLVSLYHIFLIRHKSHSKDDKTKRRKHSKHKSRGKDRERSSSCDSSDSDVPLTLEQIEKMKEDKRCVCVVLISSVCNCGFSQGCKIS